MTDDQGYGDLGCHGNDVIKTPNIDAFYEDSVRMTDFHVGPTCAPSRSGLYTGHYANSTGVWHTIGGRSLLRENEWTIADAFRDSGYRTGLFGKWHLGDEFPFRPHDRGFDDAVFHGGGGISQTPDYWGNDYFDDTYSVNDEKKAFKGYCTDVFFNEGLNFIEENKDEPFLCFIPTNAPHGPFNVDNKYTDLYPDVTPAQRARFYGMITNVDENFGILREKLKGWGLEENTILIFMTDNGTATGCSQDEDQFITGGFNAGMRGTKNSPYEGGHRVPFFIRWPEGNLLGGRDVHELTANVDFMPTLMELCGIDVPEERTFHGQSVASLVKGENMAELKERIIVTDSQRLTNPEKWRSSSSMMGKWRLVNGKELYNIADDPEQRTDLALNYSELVDVLRAGYEKWWEMVSVQFDVEIPHHLNREKSIRLNTHDWRNENCETAFHQGMIRNPRMCNGYFEIVVDEAGEFEIELRRWPKEAGHAVTAGIEGDDIEWSKEFVYKDSVSMFTGGAALDIKEARLKIGDQELSKSVTSDEVGTVFRMNLESGPCHLQSWYTGNDGLELGAYYLYIKPV